MILLTCLISIFRIITTKATREITILFHQKLNGAWTTFTEYPNSELETLYARYRAQRFKHKQPDEEVKKAFIESVKHAILIGCFALEILFFRSMKRKKIVTRMVRPSFLHLFGKRWWING